jgi:NAD(P)-dependent dehydrogenase (short-subunit alcohol dehydrogenase family)
MKLKPVGEQVVVVMGASSGIGRETALRLAKRGAKMALRPGARRDCARSSPQIQTDFSHL